MLPYALWNRDADTRRCTATTVDDVASGLIFKTTDEAQFGETLRHCLAAGLAVQVSETWSVPGVTHWYLIECPRAVLERERDELGLPADASEQEVLRAIHRRLGYEG